MDLLEVALPYVGYAAGALTVISYLPQTIRVWRTRETHDLSLWTFILLVVAGALWLTYGFMRTDWPLIATNGGLVLLNASILIAKVRNG